VQTPNRQSAPSTRKTLHIITTSYLDDNEVLVGFSDGTAAIYEAEELEKLRPAPKQRLSAWSPMGPPTSAPDPHGTLKSC